ncbi:MAG: apolipoprotein A1/A4/E family protein, partial [bacterium]|nr:apolipoprotein A1/A4/E family protein [bacterium]
DDYNRFDSFHPTTRHPRMNAEEWFGVYREAWRVFYSTEAMKAILNRANDNTYWGLFKNFIWYKYSAVIEETHPMICGFFRIKDRRQRRPGYAPEPFWRHYRRRAGDVVRLARECGRLYLEMQEVWLATRGRAQINGNLEDLRRQYDELLARLGQSRARAGEVIGRRVAGVRAGAQEAWIGAQDAWHKAEHMATAAGDDLATRLEHLRRLQRPRLTAVKQTLTRLNPLALHTHTRAHLDAYWRQTYQKLRRGDVLRINPLTLTLNALRDAKLCFIFNLTFLTGFGR